MESLYADPSELQSRVEGKVESERNTREEKENNSEVIDKDENIVEEMKRHSDDYWYPVMKYLANKRLQIFWTCLYTLFLLGIFTERVYGTSFEQLFKMHLSLKVWRFNGAINDPFLLYRLFCTTGTFWFETDIGLRLDCNERCGISYDVHLRYAINHDVSQYYYYSANHDSAILRSLRFDVRNAQVYRLLGAAVYR